MRVEASKIVRNDIHNDIRTARALRAAGIAFQPILERWKRQYDSFPVPAPQKMPRKISELRRRE